MNKQEVSYFLDSLSKLLDRDFSCPSCGSIETKLIHRKMTVFSLRECFDCGLRFRYPKDRAEDTKLFYQSDYDAGFTTSLPSDGELERLLSAGFKGGEKDFNKYIQVLGAAGLRHGDIVLDFGSSWGYGSWQLRQAGFDVYSYEVSEIRADYARSKLGCKVVDASEMDGIKGKINCVFSSHVLEHLHDPNIFLRIADQVLVSGGIVVSFVPNGEPALELTYGKKRYHQLWGHVHPLLFTRKALVSMANRYHYQPYVFSFPCSLDSIRNLQEGDMNGKELLLVAVRHSEI
jgi:2-polyprenyl-3-methyl-5-hydroxy-6-metoxy-1,4-benzoquinol methylase